MAYLYTIDVERCEVTGSADGKMNPATAFPELDTLLRKRSTTIIPSSTFPYMGAKGAGYTYVVGSDVNPTPVVAGTLRFPKRSGITSDFKRRRGRGEVCVTEHMVGEVQYTASSGFILGATSDAPGRGWYKWIEYGLPQRFSIPPIVNGRYKNYCDAVMNRYDRREIIGVMPPPDLLSVVLGPIRDGIILDTTRFDRSPSAQVVTATLADANAKQFDLLTELAEFPETLLFIRDACVKLKALCDEFEEKRLKKVSFLRTAEAVAAFWLAFRYAVMPIMYSVQDAMEVFKDLPRHYAEFKGSDEITIDAPPVDGFTATSTCKSVGRCYIKRGFAADMLFQKLWNKCQFNPIATLWELYPLSFVYDWVFNISDCIVAVLGDDACSSQGATWSVRTQGGFYYTDEVSLANAKFEIDFYHRTPIDPLTHTGPTIGNHMTWKRAIDAIALTFLGLNRALKRKRSLK